MEKIIYFLKLGLIHSYVYMYTLNIQYKKKNSNFNETKVEISCEEMGHWESAFLGCRWIKSFVGIDIPWGLNIKYHYIYLSL